MKVKELIEKLNQQNPSADVAILFYVRQPESGWCARQGIDVDSDRLGDLKIKNYKDAMKTHESECKDYVVIGED